jgi:F-type H+-transporting ATPase subunit k
MATLGSIFAGSWMAAGGGEKPKTAQGPPINASSKDEENFIQYVHADLGPSLAARM